MSPALLTLLLGLGFLGTHLLLSHPPLRGPLVARLGVLPFRALYSLVSLAFFVPWIWIFWTQRLSAAPLFDRPHLADVPAAIIGVIGWSIAGGGALRPAPSSMTAPRVEGALEVRGIARVTRHPVSLGLLLWSAEHLLVAARPVELAFFLPFALTCLLGMLHQDWRKKRADPAYLAYSQQTTILPRLAGFAELDVRDWVGVGGGFTFAVVIHALHPILFGVSGSG